MDVVFDEGCKLIVTAFTTGPWKSSEEEKGYITHEACKRKSRSYKSVAGQYARSKGLTGIFILAPKNSPSGRYKKTIHNCMFELEVMLKVNALDNRAT